MEIIINQTISIYQFEDELCRDKTDLIEQEITHFWKKRNLPNIEGWYVSFNFVYSLRVDDIRIYKKTTSYKNERYKEIVIHLPIPFDNEIPWGIKKNEFGERKIHKGNERYFKRIEVDYTEYSNFEEYLIDWMKKTIMFCLEDGFTVNGVKVKL